MRKIIVTSIIITMLCTVALLNIISPLSESGSLTLLGGDVSEKEMTFKSAGADNSSIYLELNKEATVIESEMSITSSPHDGSYPKNVEVDVGGDGDAEWAFNGEGYGSFGHQTMFSNNQEYQNLIFKTGGYNADTYLKIPKDASITSANLKIKGFYGGETYVATVDYYGLVYYTQFHPDGTFDTPIKVDDVSSSQGRAGTGVADFDNDGDLDMIVGAGSSGANMKNIYYYEKIGTGATFAPKRVVGQVYANTHPYDFAIGDFNGDGNVDFMTEGYYDTSNKGYLYFGDGFGRFTTDNYAFNLYYPYGKSQGDLNGDGYVDIVIGGQPSSGGGYRLWWFENDGSGHSYTSHDMGLTN